MRLIDADALSVTMKIPLMKVGDRYMIDYWHVTNMIEKAPTVDAAPVKHGKWMGTVCSACGESTSNHYDCDYCPHCGARMEE